MSEKKFQIFPWIKKSFSKKNIETEQEKVPTDKRFGKIKLNIDPTLCDINGNASMPYLCSLLLKCAAVHAETNDFGFDSMGGNNKTWVLSRLGVYVERYPRHDQRVTLLTWIDSVERIFTRRNFAIIDEYGSAMITAQSFWAAIDLETRRPCNLTEMNTSLIDFIVKENPYPTSHMGKIGAVVAEPEITYRPQYSDIDINRHFNSVKYIEHAINLFGEELLSGSEIRAIECVYLNETLPGMEMDFCRNGYLVDIKNHQTGESLCRIDTKLS